MNKTFIAGAIGLAATGLIWLYGKFEKKKHEAKAEEVITIDEEGDVVDPRSEAEKIIDKPYEVWVSLDKEQQSKLLAAYVVIGLFSMTLCAVGSVSGYISAYKDIATEAQEIARKAQEIARKAQEIARKAQGDTVDALNLYRDAVDRSCFTQSIQCDYISDLEEALCHARGFTCQRF